MFADNVETFGPPAPTQAATGQTGQGGGVLTSLFSSVTDLIKAGTPIVTQAIAGQTQIKTQQAARQMPYGTYGPGMTANPALAQYYGQQQSGSMIYLIMAGIAALGVGAFILTRKK